MSILSHWELWSRRNYFANRIKEKIGIPLIGETVLDDPILIAPLEVNLYELDRELLIKLKEKHQI